MYAAGGLGCPLEYFHAGFQPGFVERWQTPDFDSYLKAVYRWRTDTNGTLSVKLFWHDVEALALAAWPEDGANLQAEFDAVPRPETYRRTLALLSEYFPNPTFVYLLRRDRLRQAVSLSKASQTKNFRMIPGVQENPPVQEAAYDYDRIEGFLSWGDYCHRHWREFFRATELEPYEVTYEDLSANLGGTLSKLFTHLGLTDFTIPPPRMKRQADRTSEAFLLRYLHERAVQARSQVPSK
jgi:LPS sulfotransferase NodH